MAILWFLFFTITGIARDFEEFRQMYRDELVAYRQKKLAEFEQYRSQLNHEFQDLLREKWNYLGERAIEKRPDSPGPITPIVNTDNPPDEPISVSVGSVRSGGAPFAIQPILVPNTFRDRSKTEFVFYGTRCGVGEDPMMLTLLKPDKGNIAALWETISASDSAEQLLQDCLALRSRMNLCDWAYLLLVEKVSQTMCPADNDAATLLSVWLLCQSGFDARPGLADGHLVLLYTADRQIYGRTFYNLDGEKLYPSHQPDGGYSSMEVVGKSFSGQNHSLNMVMTVVPRFNSEEMNIHSYSSSLWKSAPEFNVPVNGQLALFMRDYPLLDWDAYAAAAVSPEISSTVFQALSIITNGMSKVEAVNTILEYMQNGFQYMSDNNQFGEEKPFFIEENFIYPFNDCEDRAILFGRLVHEILGLDVVFLHYPRHLCAAVEIPGMDKGYNVTVDGRKFWICDPCFIPSGAGDLAHPYRELIPQIIKVSFL